MYAKLLAALKALASKVPWHKAAAFAKFCYDFAVKAAAKTYDQATKILAFIKNNPGKIVDWFLKGYSVAEIISMIL